MSYSEKQMAMQKRAGKLLLDNMVQSNEIHDVKTMLTFMNGWDLMADPEALGILEKMKKREKTKKGSRGVKKYGNNIYLMKISLVLNMLNRQSIKYLLK